MLNKFNISIGWYWSEATKTLILSRAKKTILFVIIPLSCPIYVLQSDKKLLIILILMVKCISFIKCCTPPVTFMRKKQLFGYIK